MNSQLSTLETIGTILSFKSSTDLLKKKIENNEIDWDDIVKIGSRHLVLPALFYRLKEKSLGHLIPEELLNYLKEIATINRNRNQSILSEVKQISLLFNKNNIDHVFLKGTALLATNYYNDIGERMIGDIDVLVDIHKLQKARILILDIGYNDSDTANSNPLQQPKSKHLPRLIRKDKMAAVEIHRKVLKKPYLHYLDPAILLKEKRILNGIPVLDPQHLLEHNILNLQMNDDGNRRNYTHFRTAYDSLVILKKHPTINIHKDYNSPYFQNYFSIHALFFKDFNFKPISIKSKLHVQLFKIITLYPHAKYYRSRIMLFFSLISLLCNRVWHFLINKDYRKYVIKHRKRIYSYQKSKF